MSPSTHQRRIVTAAELATLRGDVTSRLADAAWAWHVPEADKPAVLAFDCGKVTGWASIGQRVARFGSFESETGGPSDDAWGAQVEALVERFVSVDGATLDAGALVVVEDVFLARGPRANPATMAGIAYYVGAVLFAARRHRLPVLRVKPSEWQTKIIGRQRREAGKSASLGIARECFGAAIRNDHMADAALLAWWVRGGA
jgi:Holliday junction resolvasome RuvABC endonuclease subunit